MTTLSPAPLRPVRAPTATVPRWPQTAFRRPAGNGLFFLRAPERDKFRLYVQARAVDAHIVISGSGVAGSSLGDVSSSGLTPELGGGDPTF
jgi:hypothetical protein